MDKWVKVWQNATYNYTAELVESPKKEKNGIAYTVSYKLPNNEALVLIKYTIHSNGVLEVNFSFNPNQSDLPNLPGLGMYMTLSNGFKDIS